MATPNFWHIQRRRKRTSGALLVENSQDEKPKHGFVTPIRHQQKIKPIPMEFSELWIGGYLVKLPLNMVPYTTQRTMMAKILKSLKNRLNALIESPTGSGKTLGLLSATCAWLVKYKEEREQSRKECPICNSSKHITESTAPSTNQENSNDAWSMNGSENPFSCENTNTENSLDSTTIVNKKPLLTLEEEFDADFRASPSPAVSRRKSLISEDSKRLKLENGEETEKKVTESHTCLPRVTIYYGTRTHKQISQVVSEFARLPYGHDDRIRHTILASRDHSCINLAVRNSGDVNASCKELISSRGVGCAYKNAMRGKYEKAQPLRRLVSKGMQGSSNVWDIEDLVEALKVSNPTLCPYFSSTRVLTQDADIVFCPFTYMIDPIIRDNSEVTLKNAIVILDEAHNVEDVCREAVSFSFTEKEIVAACADFGKKAADVEKALNKSKRKQTAQEGLDNVDGWKTEQTSDALNNLSTNYGTVNKFMSDLLDWFVGMSAEVLNKTVGRDDRQSETFSWERLYTSFEESKLTIFGEKGKSSAYSSLLTALSVVSGLSGDDSDRDTMYDQYRPLSASVICVEKFLYFFRTYFKDDNRTVYKLFICIDKPFVPFAARNRQSDIDESSSKDVLDMGKVFTENANEWLDSRSPFSGYHEIKRGYRVKLDFWCMRPALAYLDAFKECRSVILASGTLCPIETFRSELGTDFPQTMEGSQVIPKENIFAAVLPSGPTGHHLCGTYRNVQSDDRFIREISLLLKSVCEIVPKGVLCFVPSYQLLDKVYNFMEESGILRQIQTIKCVLREPRRSTQMNEIMSKYEEAIFHSDRYGPQCTGALMFAVFRGKVSEGIDFPDDRARCVVSVSIPFPNAMDEQVLEKKKFNNENCKKLRILTGDEWYTMQAYRALNQALGRCLRHRSDWGAILLADKRLMLTQSNPNAKKVSKWIREQLRPLSSYKDFTSSLEEFVTSMQSKSQMQNCESTTTDTVTNDNTEISTHDSSSMASYGSRNE